jgi:transketolase
VRTTFIKILTEEALKDDRIFLILADVGFSVVEPFCEAFPKRFLNVGIAEQNAVGIASGLALRGKVPYVYGIVPFITGRCYEQIKIDVAYMNTNVRIVGTGAGYSYGAMGATHHAIEDIAIMRVLPNMSVCCPGCANEVEKLTKYSVEHKGALYIRLAKNEDCIANHSNVTFGKFSQIINGTDFAIIATSNMLSHACDIANSFHKSGKFPALFSAHTIKPLDVEKIQELIHRGFAIVSIEEHSIVGGLASAISEQIAVSGKAVKFLPIAIPDIFSHYIGDQKFIRQKVGLGNIEERINNFLVRQGKA